MKLMLTAGSILTPIIMLVLQKRWPLFRFLFPALAVVCALIFGNISAYAIYTIIQNNTVFMTNIHGLFLNHIFILTSAYLGVFLIYRLLLSFYD